MTTEDADLLKRIEAAIERITSGQAPMRVPVDNTDPDVVLADCFRFVRARLEEAEQLQTTPVATDGFVRVRGELIERLRAWNKKWPKGSVFNYGEHQECERTLDTIVDELLAAPQSGKEEDGWISVKERLPELTCRDDSHVPGGAPATLYSERVLVFDGTVRIDNLIQAEGDPETTTFYVGTDEPITHWMPLPSPPNKTDYHITEEGERIFIPRPGSHGERE